MVDMPDLGKQVGPLPLGAWVAVVGGSLAYMFYSRNRQAKNTDITSLDATSADSLGSVGMGGFGAGFIPTSGGNVDSPSSSTDVISSNLAWGQKAFSWLVGQGLDGSSVDTAIRDYLDGNALTLQENGLITQALAKFGQVPEPLPSAPALPQVPVVTPAPVTTVAPPPTVIAPAPAAAPPVSNTYVVKAGDSLSKIAARYPSAAITWQSIYNINKGIIGGNPNLIRPGQVLTIG